jgi:hypothetical protein
VIWGPRGHNQLAVEVDGEQLNRRQPDLERALANGVQQHRTDLLPAGAIRFLRRPKSGAHRA